MSQTEMAQKIGHLDFKWGKHKGVGLINKGVKFYESFMYDGINYFLHDCVYVHNSEEIEPYIGKIVKIWEKPNKAKYVKVHWFFRPCEISNFLGDEEILQNELFLASGKGLGVMNVIMLETIAGKCDVLCISKDKRNRQPTEEELECADHVFGRTFDVANYKISNDMGDKVSELEVKFVFNRNNHESDNVEKIKLKMEDTIAGIRGSPTKTNSLSKKDPSEMGITIADIKTMSKSQTSRQDVDSKCKLATPITDVDKKVKLDRGIDDMDVRPSKKDPSEMGIIIADIKTMSKSQTSRQDVDNNCKLATPITDVDKKVKLDRGIGAIDVRPSKKARVEGSSQFLKEDKKTSHQNSVGVSRSLVPATGSFGRKVTLVSEKNSELKERQSISKPDDDERSKWFRPVPWLEKMKNAHEQGTLAILFNLDPGFTSKEVEDIIWQAFKEKCSAYMAQRTTISNPCSGQAFIILRTWETTKKIVKQLNDGCLMLSNGRVLVGSIAPSLTLPGKQSTFVGHIVLDKVKFTKKGVKEAVSTSHCSQPNTIEFDMAMEWRLLQARSDSWWKRLYKKQEEEVKKVKASLTLK